ncbi:hypothetical protein Psi01_41210 [Planobispora siamensis]|uniref:Uncharacterized protein n=1 Tax=Planobispora siamensis TaxID=936338 RepID=A0A8J3SF84_9ACTN|nr:hypothetical protein Psi01_41210 [Planobispora siamensis]
MWSALQVKRGARDASRGSRGRARRTVPASDRKETVPASDRKETVPGLAFARRR